MTIHIPVYVLTFFIGFISAVAIGLILTRLSHDEEAREDMK